MLLTPPLGAAARRWPPCWPCPPAARAIAGPSSRPGLTLLVILVTVSTASCTRARKPVVPVRGKVLFQGKPAAGASINFHPADKDAPNPAYPGAEVEADGSFQLTTYTTGDGAPVGKYVVTVVWLKENKVKGRGQSLLPGRYSNPATSGLEATVTEGSNELPPFHLTSSEPSSGRRHR